MDNEEKIALISDIHGNNWALEEVLKDIKERNIKTIFNLGDSLYGPLDPIETYNLLKKHNIYNISGNEDRIIIENIQRGKNNKTLKYVLYVINQEIIEWLKSLKKTMIIDEFFLCHGTPKRDDQYLIEKIDSRGVIVKNNKEITKEIEGITQKIICCGHSHIFNSIALESDKFVVNPGSVGLQAYTDEIPVHHKMETGTNKASYCIIKKEKNRYTFEKIFIPYDWNSASKYALKNNHKKWAKWLSTGKV